MQLQTALVVVCQAQRIDATEALCYMTHLYMMHRDLRHARRVEPTLLENQPDLPLEGVQPDDQMAIWMAWGLHPVTSVEGLLDFWWAIGARFSSGLPGVTVDSASRLNYTQIPARVLRPEAVHTVYGAPSVDGEHGSEPPNSMIQSGNTWTVRFRGKAVIYTRLKGLDYLSRLLEAPNKEISAVELVRLSSAAPTTSASAIGPTDDQSAEFEVPLVVVDDDYIKEMDQNICDLVNEEELRRKFEDQEGVDMAKGEREKIERIRGRVVGLGGRS